MYKILLKLLSLPSLEEMLLINHRIVPGTHAYDMLIAFWFGRKDGE
jgi:hypothetical protein